MVEESQKDDNDREMEGGSDRRRSGECEDEDKGDAENCVEGQEEGSAIMTIVF